MVTVANVKGVCSNPAEHIFVFQRKIIRFYLILKFRILIVLFPANI